ncbi:MAG TPA: alpha amylase C-terminal domain-containing protein, partial [Clostridium sp.]
EYEQVFNTDDAKYGGSGQIIEDVLIAEKEKFHNQPYSLKIKVPPMATLILKVKKIDEDGQKVIDIEKNEKKDIIEIKKKVV